MTRHRLRITRASVAASVLVILGCALLVRPWPSAAALAGGALLPILVAGFTPTEGLGIFAIGCVLAALFQPSVSGHGPNGHRASPRAGTAPPPADRPRPSAPELPPGSP